MKPHRTLSLALLTGLLLSACGSSDSTKPTVSLDASPSTLTQPGKVTLTATASDDVGVARVAFYRDNTLLGEDTTAPYEAQDTVAAAQNGTLTYRAVATDTSGNTAEASDAVVVNIDVTKPTVTATVSQTSPSQFTVTAQATDDRGVTRVEFYEGGQLVGTDTAAPYTLERTYTAAQNGSRTITVRAYDAQGNVGETTVTFTVNVDATKPTVSATVTQTTPGQVTVTADAQDDQGVTRVEFYEGGQLVGTDTAAPYTLERTYTAAQNGSRTITVRAYDAQGNVGETTVTFTVDIDTPPTVSLTLSSETVARPGPVTVTADAQDDRGIARVEFYVDGRLVATDTEAPYSADVSFTYLQNGTHVITVRAYDTAGQVAEASKTVTVALDAGESNDTLETATGLGIGQFVNARIAGVPRDFDYYRFTGAAGDRLRLTVRSQSVDPASTLDPYVMVLMPDGKTVLEKDDDSGQGLEADLRFDLPVAGTYYIVVTSFSIHDDEDATDDRLSNTYRLELTRR